MTIAELHPELSNLEGMKSQEIERVYYNAGGEDFVAVIAGPEDFRAKRAIDLEIEAFEKLGDDPNEVKQEFEKYHDNTIFLFVHRARPSIVEEDESPLVGMGRFMPYDRKTGLKTFNDLGEIVSNSSGTETKQKIVGALGLLGCIDDVEDISLDAKSVSERIANLFMLAHQCEDLDKVIDIATLAPDMSLPDKEKFVVIEALLKAMALYTSKLHANGDITHIVQFTAVKFHSLLQKFGYPVHELLGLEDLVYDSFGNDTDNNMIATPSVLVCEELDTVYNKIPPVTRHIGQVANTLAQVLGIDNLAAQKIA
jgi:hypothetical protein